MTTSRPAAAVSREPADRLVRDGPPKGDLAGRLRWAVNAALLAPSKLNTQPWRFEISDSSIDVYADAWRALPLSDPLGREVVIACGAAVANIELAVRALGYSPVVEVLPHGRSSACLARVSLGREEEMRPPERELFDALPHRHTDRSPLDGTALSRQLIVHLQTIAEKRGATLRLVESPGERAGLSALIHRADIAQARDPKYRGELREWAADRDPFALDGVPAAASRPGLATRLAPFASRTLDLNNNEPLPADLPHDSPAIAVLWTSGDATEHWLRAGRALEDILLTLCAEGVSAAFVNQPLEDAALRVLVREELRLDGFPQMILRIGIGYRTPPATPRRTLREVLS